MLKTQEPKYDTVGGKIVNRATGKPIPDDEPIFIFRAKDRLSVAVLDYYRSECADVAHAEVVGSRIKDFKEWQGENATTEPDTDQNINQDLSDG